MIIKDSVNIVVSGEAGQGIETSAEVISKILHAKGFYVFSIPEYMSRIRGGCNSSLLKVSKDKSPCFSKRIDVLFALDDKSFVHLEKRISNETYSFNLKKKNFYVIGYVLKLFNIEENYILSFIKKYFPQFLTDANINQFKEGFSDALNSEIEIQIEANNKDKYFFSANDALGLGCIAGGCDFIPFYPMSPSTFLQSFLVKHSDDFGIVTKQVEDEICVINMALGAWYAGARAIACSSGGGFALMCEGVSLAGMIESPIVINIAQRPGPATGLPTRSEQGDLNLALYAGHGEFPRVIYAPSSIENAFEIGKTAFDIADKLQIPVFILTDQALLESSYSTEQVFSAGKLEKNIVKTSTEYKRYKLAETPVSPRGIPNYGEGIVCVDSDEHDENGFITEDSAVRKQMVEKRLSKVELAKNFIMEPEFVGHENYKLLVISWGSNFHVIKKSIENKTDVALLHFTQVYPLGKNIVDFVRNAKKIVIIEQNATGEFERLLKAEFGFVFDYRLRKFDGLPFSVEEINDFLANIIEAENNEI